MPLPSTFAGASARGEGEFKGSYGPAPIGGPYYMSASRLTNTSPFGWTTSVKVDSSGNIYEFGQSGDSSNNQRFVFLRKRDISGTALWTKIFYSTSTGLSASVVSVTRTNSNSMALDTLGNIWISFTDGSGSTVIGQILKLDNVGNVIFGMSNTVGEMGIALDSLNNLYVTGTYGGNSQLWKYNSSGTLINSITQGSFVSDLKIAVDSANNVYVGMHSTGTIRANIVKYDSNLNGIWTGYLDTGTSPEQDYSLSLTTDSSNNLVALIGAPLAASNNLIYWLLNISTVATSSNYTGFGPNLNWGTKLSFANSSNSYAQGLAINPITNNILVTGVQPNPTTGTTYWNWYINLNSSGTVLSSGSLTQINDAQAYSPTAPGPTYATYDTSANLYLYGAVVSPTYYTSGGKVSFNYQTVENFILKDSNPLQSSHAFSSVVFDSLNFKYTAGVFQPTYTAGSNPYPFSLNGMGITSGANTSGTVTNITNTYTPGVVTYNYFNTTI